VIKRPHTVLVATDFSDDARRAIDRALRLPLAPDARVIVFHVIPELAPDLAGPAEAAARDLLGKSIARVRAPDGVEVTTELAVGKPYTEIIACARTRDVDLIVLGRHGKRTIRDRFLGSTADRLIRYSDRPVLVVNAEPTQAYRRPLIAVEIGDTARPVIERALGILDREVQEIDLLHAYRVPFEGLQYMVRSPVVDHAIENHAQHAMDELVQLVSQASQPCTASIRRGDARTVILTEVLAHSADLVVVGTHGRSGLSHVIVGSVAEWVVAAAPCDVLVTRPPQFRFEMP
jgi:nucleotide-binding universal stress UspA family protein